MNHAHPTTPQESNPNHSGLIRKLVARALDNVRAEPPHVRADLYEAAALVLDGPAADEAAVTATLIRRAEEAQLVFTRFLQP